MGSFSTPWDPWRCQRVYPWICEVSGMGASPWARFGIFFPFPAVPGFPGNPKSASSSRRFFGRRFWELIQLETAPGGKIFHVGTGIREFMGRDTEGSWHPWICPTAPEGDSRRDPTAESLFFGNDRRLKPRIIPVKPRPRGRNSLFQRERTPGLDGIFLSRSPVSQPCSQLEFRE